MVEKLLTTYIPFLTLGAAGKMHLSTNRIIAAVIIAAIAGGLAGYINLAKISVSFEYMEKHMSENINSIKGDVKRVETKVDKMYDDVYKPHTTHGK